MKPDFKSYADWLKTNFQIDFQKKPQQVYKYVIQKLQNDLENSSFWQDLQLNIKNYNDEYYLQNEYSLMRVEKIPIFQKSYDSVINKSFRKNILLNTNFPDPPNKGWILPENWFTEIKDLLRTTITVRYLDGVEFLAEKIRDLCMEHNFQFVVDYEAREEGYYAAHITIFGNFSIVDNEWNEKEISFPIEIQLTTQLQEVIKGLLHKMYEENRISSNKEVDKKWQWDYKSKEFSSNYLGHILHYVEGMILEVRDKQTLIK
jgi:hypothetical protein